jgi:hypothetical protein
MVAGIRLAWTRLMARADEIKGVAGDNLRQARGLAAHGRTTW